MQIIYRLLLTWKLYIGLLPIYLSKLVGCRNHPLAQDPLQHRAMNVAIIFHYHWVSMSLKWNVVFKLNIMES